MNENSNIVLKDRNHSLSLGTKSSTLQQCTYTDVYGDVCNGSYYEISLYGNKPACYDEIFAECTKLLMAFPAQEETFFSILYQAIEDEGMSLERLREAIKQLIANHKFRTFNVSDIVSYDKTVKIAENISTLRFITKRLNLGYSDIVVVKGMSEGNECKMYGVKYEIENSPYKSRIIGTWNSDTNSWNIFGTINDNTIPKRQQEFKQSLYNYCNYPPQYNGKYDTEMVKSFSDYYSQVVGFGDTLRYETLLSWDVESALENWNIKNK